MINKFIKDDLNQVSISADDCVSPSEPVCHHVQSNGSKQLEIDTEKVKVGDIVQLDRS